MERLKVELSDDNNSKIVDGTIIKDDNTTIYVEIDDPDLKDVRLNLGDKINVKIFGDVEGLKVYQGVMTYRLGGLLTIAHLTVMFKMQRRKDLKINVNFKTVIACVSRSPEVVVRAKFKDISAGGICFSLEPGQMRFYEGEVFEGILNLFTPIFAKFEVLRATENDIGEILYGCQFKEFSVEEEQIVREFVFKTQLLSRKRMSNRLY